MRVSAERERCRCRSWCAGPRGAWPQRGARWSIRPRAVRCSSARGAGPRRARTGGRGRTRRFESSPPGRSGRSARCATRSGRADGRERRIRVPGWRRSTDGTASFDGHCRPRWQGRTGSHAGAAGAERAAGPLGQGVEAVGPSVPGMDDLRAGGGRLRGDAGRRGGVPGGARRATRASGRGGRGSVSCGWSRWAWCRRSSTRGCGSCTRRTGRTSSGCGSRAGRGIRCRPRRW